MTRQQLAEVLDAEPNYRVEQVWDGLYRRLSEPEEMTDVPAALRRRLAELEAFSPALHLEGESADSSRSTVKWLFALRAGNEPGAAADRIETVLMHYPDRSTVCVSTQAGCAMRCSFCATGQAGFNRNLTTGEIVEQVMRAARSSREAGRRLQNVVFMGMGEPLANLARVMEAVRRLNGDLGIAARHLTISTVGLVPGIRTLSAEKLQVNLAVSLHAANDPLRDRLVPINRRYPIGVLAEACRQYVARTGRRLSFEWALIDGVNDGERDAEELAAIALPIGAHVNLIPLNPTPGYPTRGSAPARVRAFRGWLAMRGVNATVRQNRGTAIAAACGQLAAGAPVRLAPRASRRAGTGSRPAST